MSNLVRVRQSIVSRNTKNHYNFYLILLSFLLQLVVSSVAPYLQRHCSVEQHFCHNNVFVCMIIHLRFLAQRLGLNKVYFLVFTDLNLLFRLKLSSVNSAITASNGTVVYVPKIILYDLIVVVLWEVQLQAKTISTINTCSSLCDSRKCSLIVYLSDFGLIALLGYPV